MPAAKSTTKKRSVRLPAFAKINLCLHVIGKRPDGYHELRTIFQAISLHDTLELSLMREPGIALESTDESLPAGPENLVHRAIEALGCEIGFRGGIHARLEKRIPVARGLGGGSSDAAAALIGMLRLTKAKVPLPRLMEIAAGLGADVPFLSFRRPRPGGESRRRDLPAAGCATAHDPGGFAAGDRRQHEGRLPMGLCGIDKAGETQ